jgi:hypothetical protein
LEGLEGLEGSKLPKHPKLSKLISSFLELRARTNPNPCGGEPYNQHVRSQALSEDAQSVALHNRDAYIVTWASQPANVNFILNEQSTAKGYRICSEAEGLKLKYSTGFMVIVK